MMQGFYFNIWLLLFHFIFCFKPTPYRFEPEVGCIFLSRQNKLLLTKRVLAFQHQPTTRDRNVPTSLGHRASHLCGCTNLHPINCLLVSSIWICRFFTTFHCVSASFFLTPRISFCADTFSRSNLHETILLRQAFCALLNDGCLREMIIMIDFQP